MRIVLGEWYFGAFHGDPAKQAHNLTLRMHLCQRFLSVPFEDRSVEEYGRIRADLAAKGTPIGPITSSPDPFFFICLFRHYSDPRNLRAPTPFSLVQARTQRIALHIAAHGQKMLVLLYWKRLEAALIQVAAAGVVVMGVPSLRVRQGQPSYEAGQRIVAARPE